MERSPGLAEGFLPDMSIFPDRWHHRPEHVFVPNCMYMVTGATLHKAPLLRGPERLAILADALFSACEAHGWLLQAWALFPNHYHFVAKSPEDASTLKPMIQRVHSQSARLVNRLDGVSGRKVWFQYWDTCLTYESSYLARLAYVHSNAVKHGAARDPEEYPWCSAGWFRTVADPAFVHRVFSYKSDQLSVEDDY